MKVPCRRNCNNKHYCSRYPTSDLSAVSAEAEESARSVQRVAPTKDAVENFPFGADVLTQFRGGKGCNLGATQNITDAMDLFELRVLNMNVPGRMGCTVKINAATFRAE